MSFKVMAQQCKQCLFSPNKIVNNRRRNEVLRECRRTDSHFVCHKASIGGQEICCRGFFDTQTSQLIRIAERLNMVEFVELQEESDYGSS